VGGGGCFIHTVFNAACRGSDYRAAALCQPGKGPWGLMICRAPLFSMHHVVLVCCRAGTGQVGGGIIKPRGKNGRGGKGGGKWNGASRGKWTARASRQW
jgi:hypothetical protein